MKHFFDDVFIQDLIFSSTTSDKQFSNENSFPGQQQILKGS
jgi:hypothetical protein